MNERDAENSPQNDATFPDPRDPDVRGSEDEDPHSGASDDPRVDPTPDRRQSDVASSD